jgi:dephospho-CoA kinase
MAVKIGLTGGIAMGKSTISNFLKTKSIPVVDADQIAHDVLNFDDVIAKLTATFGETILTKDGKINRKRLGKLVFDDEKKLTKLNQIVQPPIRQAILNQMATFESQPLVILDAPVLIEQGYETDVDELMVVTTSHKIQIERLMARDHLTENKAKQRIQAQMPIENKIKKADIVIDTSGTIEETRSQVVKCLVKKNLLQVDGEFGEVK